MFSAETSHTVVICLMFLVQGAAPGGHGVEGGITFQEQPGRLIIRAEGQTVATYVYEDAQIQRPYFSGIRAPGGVEVTRHHPPRKGIDAEDHATMHPGLCLAFGDISGSDFWRNKAHVKHAGFVRPPYTVEEHAGFAVLNRYIGEEGEICRELCNITILRRPAGYLILWDSEFTSEEGSFLFGDQEEMGLGVRLATPLAVGAGKGGRILDDTGNVNEKHIWGKSARWCDYAGPIGGLFAGIMVMPDPDNFGPCRWHVRDYGFMAANPFGRKAFNLGDVHKTVVAQGESLSLRFGVLVHSAANERQIDLDAAYEDYLALRRQFSP